MDYWPNQEDNGHCGPIRKKQDRGAVPFWIYGHLVIALPFLVGMSQCYPIERQLVVVNWCGGLHGWCRV